MIAALKTLPSYSTLPPPPPPSTAMSGQLPADLMPSVTIEAADLPPGSVVHSALATLYVEPCVVYLRVRWGGEG